MSSPSGSSATSAHEGAVGSGSTGEAVTARPPAGLLARWQAASERQLAAVVAVTLALVGLPLGVLWEALSPPGPLGVRLPAGIEADESEAFVQADGRFAVIAVVVGLTAGVLAWRLRRARGVLVVLALAVGGVVGSVLTDLVGHLLRGQGRTTVHDGLTYYAHLPLQVRMTGLLCFEPALALLVYGVCVAFAARDDLGRPDEPALSSGGEPAAGSDAQMAPASDAEMAPASEAGGATRP